jgi:type I restriction enzyme M protein
MLTGELISQINKIWNDFWKGSISTPHTLIEQSTYLLFIRRLDEILLTKEKQANPVGIAIYEPVYTPELKLQRWGSFRQNQPDMDKANLVLSMFGHELAPVNSKEFTE